MTSVLMATTDGLTSATTSAMLGSSSVGLSVVDGGVHSGLIGSGAVTGAGPVTGAIASGVLMVMQPDAKLRLRVRMMKREISKVFKFNLFIAISLFLF
jgi:hypothetical protein